MEFNAHEDSHKIISATLLVSCFSSKTTIRNGFVKCTKVDLPCYRPFITHLIILQKKKIPKYLPWPLNTNARTNLGTVTFSIKEMECTVRNYEK